jgi:hypothetical protein
MSTGFLVFFPYLGPLKLNYFYFLTSYVIGAGIYEEDIFFWLIDLVCTCYHLDKGLN